MSVENREFQAVGRGQRAEGSSPWRPGPGTPLAELCQEYRRVCRMTSGERRNLRTAEMLLARMLGRPAAVSDLADLTLFREWLRGEGRTPFRFVDAMQRVERFSRFGVGRLAC